MKTLQLLSISVGATLALGLFAHANAAEGFALDELDAKIKAQGK